VFAVLTERVRWSVALRTAVFMPMAISLFAAGVLSGAMPSSNILQGSPQKGLTMRQGLHAGQVAQLGRTGIPASDVAGGDQAAKPATVRGGVSGVV